ncbi:MAG: hypothetical protein PHO94_09435 [Petrimonas sp.]|nr:hypothetical protein [Petrimonas sp.]
MAVTKIHRTSRMTLYITMVISLVVIALFIFGGQVPVEKRLVPDLSEPAFTDALLYWIYILLAITVLILFLFAVIGFFSSLKTNPKKAINSLLVVVALAALLIITYVMGSGTPLDIVGYTGSDNVPPRLKLTDMWLFSIYVMLFLVIVSILAAPLFKLIRKK